MEIKHGWRRAGWALVPMFVGIACGKECVTTPDCAIPPAVRIGVSAAGGGPITTGFVIYGQDTMHCDLAPGNFCQLDGYPGSYDFAVGAPGFVTVHEGVNVDGDVPTCGCPSTIVKEVDVSLVPSG